MTENNNVATREMPAAERFAVAVLRQYQSEIGQVKMTEQEETLLQHLYVKCDMAFAEANAKLSNGKTPITWKSIDMVKLATDAVHRIKLGLDALIPGFIYPIAYWNDKKKLYDVDLRVGYKGEIFYTQKASMRPIHDIRVELVYSTDEFTVYKKDSRNKIEGYTFKVNNPFSRGDVVGGYAYVEYEDDSANLLRVMSKEDIEKRRKKAKGDSFWSEWYEEMAYKTLVHSVAGKIPIDPEKVNSASLASVRAQDETDYQPQDVDYGNAADLVLDESAYKESQQAAALPEPPREAPVQTQAAAKPQAAPVKAQDDDMPDFLRDQQKTERRPAF